jgi:hypothetical protein
MQQAHLGLRAAERRCHRLDVCLQVVCNLQCNFPAYTEGAKRNRSMRDASVFQQLDCGNATAAVADGHDVYTRTFTAPRRSSRERSATFSCSSHASTHCLLRGMSTTRSCASGSTAAAVWHSLNNLLRAGALGLKASTSITDRMLPERSRSQQNVNGVQSAGARALVKMPTHSRPLSRGRCSGVVSAAAAQEPFTVLQPADLDL